MLENFDRMLGCFPFSRLSKRGAVLRIYAIEESEPPLIEREFGAGTGSSALIEAAREFAKSDCCCQVESAWDLWQFEGDWKLAPSKVTLSCFGPEFVNDLNDHLRIDFGTDAHFLPAPRAQGGLRMVQANLESLKTLTRDIEERVVPERLNLWSESGVNFGEALKQAVASLQVN